MNLQRAQLKIFVDPSAPVWLKDRYTTAAGLHNRKMNETAPFEDSGFDLLVPELTEILGGSKSTFVDHKIRCAMTWNGVPSPFHLYPRSSISKTPLILANHVGVIDSGYRGNIIGAFRKISDGGDSTSYTVAQDTRLLQICHPLLVPITVIVVDMEAELGEATARGNGGFGSTNTK